MNLIIREAISSDYKEIYRLIIEVHNLHLRNRPDVYLEIDNPLLKQQFEDLLKLDDTKIFTVENLDNKELLAYSITKMMQTQAPIFIPKTFAFIDDFCVKSNYKRRGIGKLLFNHVADYVKTQGATSLQLNVWEFNKDAIKFYEVMGMNTRNRRMELNL